MSSSPPTPTLLPLAAFVVLNTVVNYLGIQMTARVNRYMLIAELIVLAIFIVVGIVALASGKGAGFSLSPLYNADTFSWSVVFGAVSIAVLSFLGFDGISMLAEESREEAPAGRPRLDRRQAGRQPQDERRQPAEQPSASAVSSTLSPSRNRSTSAARCRGGTCRRAARNRNRSSTPAAGSA